MPSSTALMMFMVALLMVLFGSSAGGRILEITYETPRRLLWWMGALYVLCPAPAGYAAFFVAQDAGVPPLVSVGAPVAVLALSVLMDFVQFRAVRQKPSGYRRPLRFLLALGVIAQIVAACVILETFLNR